MEPWAKRIDQILKDGEPRGLSVPGLGKACRLKQPSVWQWFNDTEKKQATKSISALNAVRAAQYLGTTAEYLITGKGPSHLLGLDLEKLEDAIRVAMKNPENLSPEGIVKAYAILLQRDNPPATNDLPTPDQKGAPANGPVETRDRGTVADPRRTNGKRTTR